MWFVLADDVAWLGRIQAEMGGQYAYPCILYAPPSMLLKRLVVGVPNSKLPDISMYDTRCLTAGQASEASRMNWFLLAGP